MNIRPPKKAISFLRWFCREDYIDEIEGDLIEIFEKESLISPRKAKLKFFLSILRCFRPAFLKLFKPSHSTNTTDMFRHNFMISLRSFKRNKSSFTINVLGLSTGLACSLLIYLWVMDEMNVDHFNEKDDQLFEVLANSSNASGTHTGNGTQGPLATAMSHELPEVEHGVTVVPFNWFGNKGAISFGDVHLKAKPQFISKDYFNAFTCKIVQGDASNPLPDMNSLMISTDLAQKLFHTTDNIIGKIVQWKHDEHSGDYHITGVFETLPSNATSSFDLLFNFDEFSNKRKGMLGWLDSDPNTYLILKKGVDVAEFNNKIKHFVQLKDSKVESTLMVQKFSERYLHGNYENGVAIGGRIFYVNLLSIIGFFILAIACINFMNLTTARATRRIKEVGVKKTVGASRAQLITQYFSESTIISFVSLIIAIGIVVLVLPSFNVITGKNLFIPMNANLAIILGSILFVTSLLAGGYPAIYLSSFNPATVLKGKLQTSFGELFARQGLVIFQFTISVILIVAVWIVYEQMEFIQGKNLGYKKDNIIILEMEGTPVEKLQSFHNELKRTPGVISAGSFYHNLSGMHGSIELDWDGKTPDQHTDFANLEVGYDFIETMNIEFKEGHSFTQTEKSKNEIILNEAAIKFMSLKDPLGKTIRFWGHERQIVGITKDFNFESLHEEVKPCFFQVYPAMYNYVVKIEGGRERETVARLEKLHGAFSSGYPFEYKFLDENYQALYASEQRVSVLSRYFAGIAVMISCLGLFALAAFTAEKRIKEIGIRKILGSSEIGIIYLLSSDFTKIVFISILIALPISYIMTKYWLDTFAFRIPLEWYYFVGAGASALIIAWVTIGGNTIKAARVNPVTCLKIE